MKYPLNLQDLLLGDVTRLRFVIRYSTCQRMHNENVAEHSYYVALYCMFVCDWVDLNGTAGEPGWLTGKTYDRIDVLQRALLHDLEECVTGDVERTFKHCLPEITESLHLGAEMQMCKLIDGIFGHQMAEEYVNEWNMAKNEDCIEGRIVRFADYLAALSYMCGELIANSTLKSKWGTMHDYHEGFKDEKYDFIRPLVEQAEEILLNAFRKMGVA